MFKEIVGVNSDIKGDAKLWRYMDFTKLVSLLSTQSIYLCRSDEFKDVFEGVLFGYGVEDAREDLEKIFSGSRTSERFIQAQLEKAEKLVDYTMWLSEQNRKNVFINCWHLNEYESAAMWDLYLKSSEGIAIQTTFDKIKKSLNVCKEDIFIGEVKYIDHTKQRNLTESYLEPFFTKRISFKHEQEVRLVYALTPHHEEYVENSDVKGKSIQVSLTDLIERVYVSPDADAWFVDVVKVVLAKFNIDAEVVHSDLYKIK
ncbi:MULTISPECIES: DUF2971 domain-containing protein [Bacillus cereus group]|uniref:DUF2971 domain-containing protein n=1 Tax=Bacillus cereus group TaxID=86661 RepID=UPI00187953C5|nr:MULTISPECIES: DUF2971 domain-containing protein [Bacillus cereus group]MBE7145292.1 DUF2971 domain-containing protein [Bacillus paranthracis]MCU5211700.1 DUF2971 domain-containing protein [Bacillus paranthracis]MDA2146865.1 DUF2971 domain-containing protein [Bacillus cereus group sp. Bc248]MDA2174720.1 DUF2971 domain-containing protein [Bacillus cereus group sp. Bc247]MDA2593678.1 DUF2971 domain-containing protein [Bacillus cereus group sp. Bc065]